MSDFMQRHSSNSRFSRSPSLAKSVGSFVPELTKKAFQKYGFSTAVLLTDWSSIAGRELAAATRPERLKWPKNVDAYQSVEGSGGSRSGATLVLRVEPARALDVQYQSRQIVNRINAFFGYCAVSELRILQAPVEAAHVPKTVAPRPAVAPSPSLSASQPADSHGNGLADALGRLQENIRAERLRKRLPTP